MAKFRTNHEKQGMGGTTVVKVGLFALVFGGLFWVFNMFTNPNTETVENNEPEVNTEWEIEDNSGKHAPADEDSQPGFDSGMPQEYLPANSVGQIVNHAYFSLAYNEQHEQAEWVAYELTRRRLNANWEDRSNDFRPDPRVKSSSASPYDYRKSGYDRGHLVPSVDMAFDKQAVSETYFMSNISPQKSNFNKGIWRELEEQCRDWAIRFRHLYVVTGPVLSIRPIGSIGENEVSVPAAFYRILLDLTGPEYKAIAFVLPNEVSYEPIDKYAVSIDEVEELTGFDFFAHLLEEELEKELEAMNDPSLWESSENRYQVRVEKWNKK